MVIVEVAGFEPAYVGNCFKTLPGHPQVIYYHIDKYKCKKCNTPFQILERVDKTGYACNNASCVEYNKIVRRK